MNIRNRDDPATQKMGVLIPLDKVVSRLIELKECRKLESKIDMTD